MGINKQTLGEFQKELGSRNATPGGGVVAAISAGFAASLIEMVCNLTIGKKGYEKVQKDVLKIHKNSLELKKKFEKLAEEDKEAFEKVMSAYKTRDKVKIKKALNHAIGVPMEVRKFSIEIEKLAIHIGKIGNKNAMSDAKTAIYLSHAAQKSALENVKINKLALKKL